MLFVNCGSFRITVYFLLPTVYYIEVIMFREVKKEETLRKRQLLRLGHA